MFEAGVGKDFQSDIAVDTIYFEEHSGEILFTFTKIFATTYWYKLNCGSSHLEFN